MKEYRTGEWQKVRMALVLAAAITLSLLVACDGKAPVEEVKRPETLDEALRDSFMLEGHVCPLLDGGALVVLNDGAWYVKGGLALKVKETSEMSAAEEPLSLSEREKDLWLEIQRLRADLKEAKGE